MPTGFADLDAATNGLHPGQMIVVAARPGFGKALALDTPLPTRPAGRRWVTSRSATSCWARTVGRRSVVAATEVMLGRPCYEVAFSDGTVIVADAEHQWLTVDGADRRAVRTTRGARRARCGAPTGGPTTSSTPRRPLVHTGHPLVHTAHPVHGSGAVCTAAPSRRVRPPATVMALGHGLGLG